MVARDIPKAVENYATGHMCVQNNESAAIFVYKKSPVGNELSSHVKTFFYSKQFAKLLTS